MERQRREQERLKEREADKWVDSAENAREKSHVFFSGGRP